MDAYTLFLTVNNLNYLNISGRLIIANITFRNADTSVATRFLHGNRVYDNVTILGNKFLQFTVCGTIGVGIVTDGIHIGSDAQTTVNKCHIKSNSVLSDLRSTSQCPKSFHIYHCVNLCFESNEVVDKHTGTGDSYLFRAVGGGYDTLPVVNRGFRM